VWTIGNGTTRINGQPVTASTPPIDKATALALMETELGPDCASVSAHAPAGATPNQIAACTSFSYNEGISAFLGSTILHLWLQGDVAGAAQHFMDWVFDHDPVTHQLVRVQGLVNRREAEQAVFLGTGAQAGAIGP
jgi:lysozyme